MRLAGASLWFVLAATTTACGVGGGGGSGDDASTNNVPTGPNMGGVDDNNMDLGITCTASLSVNGSFVATGGGDDGAGDSCDPVGTWTFQAAVKNNTCPAAPTLLPSYSFSVTLGMDQDGDINQQMLSSDTVTALGSMKYHLSMSESAQGCSAHLELGSPDGTQYWNLQPELPNGMTTLTGEGEYDVYSTNSWPWQ
jgi:hypothetical protein